MRFSNKAYTLRKIKSKFAIVPNLLILKKL